MRFPRPDDPELMGAIRRYVHAGPADPPGRRYLKLLHGNALDISGQDRTEFELALGRDARQITDRDLSTLLDGEAIAPPTPCRARAASSRPAAAGRCSPPSYRG